MPEFEQRIPRNLDEAHAFVEKYAGSPGRAKVYVGVGIAELTAKLLSLRGEPIILSNEGDLHEIQVYLKAGQALDEEELEEHVRAIETDQRTLHLQVQVLTIEDILDFRSALKLHMDLVGGFGQIENEYLHPDYEDGLAGPSKIRIDGENEIDGFVARFNIPINS